MSAHSKREACNCMQLSKVSRQMRGLSRSLLRRPDVLKGVANCPSFVQRKPASKQTKVEGDGSGKAKPASKSDAPARGKASKAAEKEKPKPKPKADKKDDRGKKASVAEEKKVVSYCKVHEIMEI